MDLSCSSHSFSTSSLLWSNSDWSLLSCLFNPSLPLTPPFPFPLFLSLCLVALLYLLVLLRNRFMELLWRSPCLFCTHICSSVCELVVCSSSHRFFLLSTNSALSSSWLSFFVFIRDCIHGNVDISTPVCIGQCALLSRKRETHSPPPSRGTVWTGVGRLPPVWS